MANTEPPPFDEEYSEIKQEDEDDADLFTSANEDIFQSRPVASVRNINKDTDLFSNMDNPRKVSSAPIAQAANFVRTKFAVSTEESETDMTQSPDSDEEEVPDPAQTLASASATMDVSASVIGKRSHLTKTDDGPIEEDDYMIEIKIVDVHKVGDGMTSYITYKIVTKTTIPAYLKPETTVTRRFSDFLGLHSKLSDKHVRHGRIVPPAPEKSMLGTTKVKISKEESASSEFIERRKAALERYLCRIAGHPILRIDPDFRDFLETDGDLPKATNTSALSGAGVKRLFHRFGDAVEKMTFKMDETDEWFDEKQSQIDSLDEQFRKLHASLETLVVNRRELSVNTASFAKSAAMLGNAEEHTALSRALSQLAEMEERIEQVHVEQCNSDFFTMDELLKDYIALVGAVKEVFHERVKMFRAWKDAEALLNKKREQKSRLEQQQKTEKIPEINHEISDCEQKVDLCEEEFMRISKIIRKEVARFDRHRVQDFKAGVIKYLESLMENQQQLIKYWEAFLPEAKAIA